MLSSSLPLPPPPPSRRHLACGPHSRHTLLHDAKWTPILARDSWGPRHVHLLKAARASSPQQPAAWKWRSTSRAAPVVSSAEYSSGVCAWMWEGEGSEFCTPLIIFYFSTRATAHFGPPCYGFEQHLPAQQALKESAAEKTSPEQTARRKMCPCFLGKSEKHLVQNCPQIDEPMLPMQGECIFIYPLKQAP